MLAEGRCFTCNDVGHFARNCPKTANVVSKQKGKPPGFGVHAVRFSNARDKALYESTEVLDTLPIGAVGLPFESNNESDQEVEYAPPPRSIGDLYAFNAELALEMGQLYPGDAAGVEFRYASATSMISSPSARVRLNRSKLFHSPTRTSRRLRRCQTQTVQMTSLEDRMSAIKWRQGGGREILAG
jgi:hypothetical protein